MQYDIEKNYIKNVFDGIFDIKIPLVSDIAFPMNDNKTIEINEREGH